MPWNARNRVYGIPGEIIAPTGMSCRCRISLNETGTSCFTAIVNDSGARGFINLQLLPFTGLFLSGGCSGTAGKISQKLKTPLEKLVFSC
jgi:hypothetical protein